MGRLRRAYYDWFSKRYDAFVALHSRDRQGAARNFLADHVPVTGGGSVLDLCTGTATLLPSLQARVCPRGRVVGVDFSVGMLEMARAKTRDFPNMFLVEAEAETLPFGDGTFDAVTCSHAFYELAGRAQVQALLEVRRVLKPAGAFLMMEHDVPANLLVRALFYLRLASMGAGRALSILRHEQELLGKYFGRVKKLAVPEGRSKVWVCWP
jgi:demethylmenaquinone methyltransferase/2-methoxy-6-polyprenyl-1,4-benzoquinol methylase